MDLFISLYVNEIRVSCSVFFDCTCLCPEIRDSQRLENAKCQLLTKRQIKCFLSFCNLLVTSDSLNPLFLYLLAGIICLFSWLFAKYYVYLSN